MIHTISAAACRTTPTIAHRACAAWLIVIAWTVPGSAQGAAAMSGSDPFARRSWHLELGGAGAIEAWNYNISHEDLIAFVPGLTYGLRDGLVFAASWPMY